MGPVRARRRSPGRGERGGRSPRHPGGHGGSAVGARKTHAVGGLLNLAPRWRDGVLVGSQRSRAGSWPSQLRHGPRGGRHGTYPETRPRQPTPSRSARADQQASACANCWQPRLRASCLSPPARNSSNRAPTTREWAWPVDVEREEAVSFGDTLILPPQLDGHQRALIAQLERSLVRTTLSKALELALGGTA